MIILNPIIFVIFHSFNVCHNEKQMKFSAYMGVCAQIKR